MDNSNKDVVAIVKQMVADGKLSQDIAEFYVPELKETKDEEIRRGLINGFKFYSEQEYWGTDKFPLKITEIIAWLEKQGEQKPIEWKPSEEQISALIIAQDTLSYENDHKSAKAIKELLEQLKAL